MWMLTLFDLPTGTKQQRKAYHQLRQGLLKDGFTMVQYSVYGRHCSSEENATVHERRVLALLPRIGEVRIIMLTDKQFERMRVFYGAERKLPEKPPEQLSLF
jgi:CRISPR-associated protein Cas2